MTQKKFLKLLRNSQIQCSIMYENAQTGILLPDTIFWFSKLGWLKRIELRAPIGEGVLEDV